MLRQILKKSDTNQIVNNPKKYACHMGNIRNPKEKIYLLCYPKPTSKSEISMKLYGKNNRRLYFITKELDKDWWDTYEIDEIPEKLKEKATKDLKDGRKKTSKFCYAMPEVLMGSIVADLKKKKVSFTTDEFILILSFIDSDGFRDYVSEHLKKHDIRTYPDDFAHLKIALGQAFGYHNFIYEMIETEVGKHGDKIRGFHQKYSLSHNLMPGLEEEIKKMGHDLIKKMACLSPGGYLDIKHMCDMIYQLAGDIFKIELP